MQTKALTVALSLLALAGAGCWQKSVFPFYRTSDLIRDPALLGTWAEPDKAKHDRQSWVFSEDTGKTYRVVFKHKETELQFDGHTFDLGGVRLLDLYSRERSISGIPAHHLFRYSVTDGALQLQLLSGEWIKERVKTHPNEIAHVRAHDPEHPDDPDKGEIVLTDRTEQLQKFILGHLHDEGFFEKAETFTKIAAQP